MKDMISETHYIYLGTETSQPPGESKHSDELSHTTSLIVLDKKVEITVQCLI